MRRLNTFLITYLASVQEKELWGPGIEIVFSGASVEGEGEHKIISDIKKSKFVVPSEYAYERGEQGIQWESMVKVQKKSNL